MTGEFMYLMRLIGCEVQGKALPLAQKKLDWNRLMILAREQTMDILAACALRQVPHAHCPMSAEELRVHVIRNHMRKREIIGLLEKMEKEGLQGVLLKGFAVGEEYPVPDLRISADTDIWVLPENEKCACAFFRANGFAVQRRAPRSHHRICVHPQMGIVEVHIALYETIVEKIWLKGCSMIREPFQKMQTEAGRFFTLGVTDHLLFLSIHMAKHFINSGISLRMMLDVGLYIQNHMLEIDWPRYWDTLHNSSFCAFMRVVLGTMVAFFGFSKERFPPFSQPSQEDMGLFLQDLEEGGWLGKNDLRNREQGLYAYNRAQIMKTAGQAGYFRYMLRWQSKEWLAAAFPSKEYMKEKYLVVRKHSWLLPAAWFHRTFFRSLGAIGSGVAIKRIITDRTSLPQSAKRRMDMFTKFQML